MEYLYSDEGQTHWLSGYCHPIRFDDMVERGVVPQDLLDRLPPAEAYANAVFPTLEQIEGNRAAVVENWDSVVGADVVE
jgi:putative spermidine/putrescine transport system substrate-binding protein